MGTGRSHTLSTHTGAHTILPHTHTHSHTHTHTNCQLILAYTTLPHTHTHTHTHTGSVTSDSSDESGDEEGALYRKLEDIDEVEVDYLHARLVMEGPLQRKMVRGAKERRVVVSQGTS